MSKKDKNKPKTQELPNMTGAGVERLTIPALDKAIDNYQTKKAKRCQASPGEIAAKQELTELMHKHREQLPVNGDGVPFYRYEDRDYLLEEKLKINKVQDDGEEE